VSAVGLVVTAVEYVDRMFTFHGAPDLEGLIAPVQSALVSNEDPFQPQMIIVPTVGVRRWLTQRLARGLPAAGGGQGAAESIVANVAMPLPGELRRTILDLDLSPFVAENAAAQPLAGSWQANALQWVVLEVLRTPGTSVDGAEFAELVGSAPAVIEQAAQIAKLFDRYHLRRPEMVLRWNEGADEDGQRRQLEHRLTWQPRLWRAVRQRIGSPSPPEVERARLQFGAETVELLGAPGNIVCFGVESPTPNLWTWLQLFARHKRVEVLVAGPDRALPLSPLTASWAATDELHLVGTTTTGQRSHSVAADGVPSATLLARLQGRLANQVSSTDAPLSPADRSLQLHGCAGTRRQVEVARDLIWHALNDDPSLTESDICVAVGSMKRFAPHLASGLRAPVASAEGDPVSLRCRIADPTARWVKPWVDAMGAVLGLLVGRSSASEFLEFCSQPAVRAAWRLDRQDLDELARWRDLVGMKWGLNGAARAAYGFGGGTEQNSLRYSVDRILLGGVLDSDAQVPTGVVPYPVGEGFLGLVARTGDLVDRLIRLRTEAQTDRQLGEWGGWLRSAAEELLIHGAEPDRSPNADQRSEREEFEVFVQRLVGGAPPGGGVALSIDEFVRVVQGAMSTPRSPQPVHPGFVSVAAASALAAVPFRMVVLMGLDEDAVALAQPASDDLIQLAPLPGDPDPRADSRRHLFDAVMSAKDRLVVTFDDRNATTNEPVPPSFLVSELTAELESLLDGTDTGIEDLTFSHALAPFDDANFRDGESFDRLALEGALARRRLAANATASPHARSVSQPPTAETPSSAAFAVELSELSEAAAHPLNVFMKAGLDASFPGAEREHSDVLATGVGALAAWSIVTDAAVESLGGGAPENVFAVAREAGLVPLGQLGEAAVSAFAGHAAQLADGVARGMGGHDAAGVAFEAERVEVPVDLAVRLDNGSPVRIFGSVRTLSYRQRFWVTSARYSKNSSTEVLLRWVELLALAVTEVPAVALVAARSPSSGSSSSGSNSPETIVTRLTLSADTAGCQETLAWLTERLFRARNEAIPFVPRTAAAFVDHDLRAARSEWDPTFGGAPGERRNVAVHAALGDLDFDELVDTTGFRKEAAGLWERVRSTCSIEQLPAVSR
jgi:exodeoxyribonuclease V gamma subunit